jgi:hypothetical protein
MFTTTGVGSKHGPLGSASNIPFQPLSRLYELPITPSERKANMAGDMPIHAYSAEAEETDQTVDTAMSADNTDKRIQPLYSYKTYRLEKTKH